MGEEDAEGIVNVRCLPFMSKALIALLAVFLVACGGSSVAELDPDEAGKLRIGVQLVQDGRIHPEVVQAVHVELRSRSEDGKRYRLALERTTTPNQWDLMASGLRMDLYDVQASMYADEEATELLFVSRRGELLVRNGQIGGVLLFVHPKADDEGTERPRFEVVTVDKIITEPGGDVGIRVQAAGAHEPIELNGYFPPGSPEEFRGSFTPEGNLGSRALYLTWTAPLITGLRWFGIELEDDRGDVAGIGISVMVGTGEDFFPPTWNLGPSLGLTTHIYKDDETTRLHLWLRADDDSKDSLQYAWTGDCAGGFIEGTPPMGGAGPEGTLRTDEVVEGRVGMFFHYVIPTYAAQECTLSVRVVDGTGAATSRTLHIDPTRLIPTVRGGD